MAFRHSHTSFHHSSFIPFRQAQVIDGRNSERVFPYAQLEHSGDSGRNDASGFTSVEDHTQASDHSERDAGADRFDFQAQDDHFEFIADTGRGATEGRGVSNREDDENRLATANAEGDGRPDPDPGPISAEDSDPDTAPPPIDSPDQPEAPTNQGRPSEASPGTPQVTPPAPPPGPENANYGRPDDLVPDPPPDPVTLTTYTSGGLASTAYNVTIEFVGTWSTELQAAFIDAADYLSTIILADLPDAIVDGIAIDDISITATLEGIDGVGGILGSAGPRSVRDDGTYLPETGAMTFDIEDAQNQLNIGNWETIILHEMMHAMGFGTLWSLMGLTSGSVAGGDIRFTGVNATDTYQTEFAGIAGADSGSLLGVPIETDGGPGTAGGHWDELLFDAEIMTGYVDAGGFVSLMTIAAFEDMGYDTIFDNPYSATDQTGPMPIDPLLDLFA